MIAGILREHGTPAERLAALERIDAPELTYGLHPRIDEEAEITALASYLQATKRSWRAELASRDAGNAPRRQSWEAFQHGMDELAVGIERNLPVWFLQANGYQVNGRNRAELTAIAAAREHPARDDPQQQFGVTYQRDTLYAMAPDGPISRHVGTFDAATSADQASAWVNGVVRVHSDAEELRLRITAVADAGAGGVSIRGTVLEGPVGNQGLAVGSVVEIGQSRSTGAMTIHNAETGLREQLASGAWTARFETFAYHQGLTRVNEGVGMHLRGAGAPEKRNRGKILAVDDALFERIRDLYRNPEAPERGYGQTVGPTRTRLNFAEAGWDIGVEPYRRLGGDAMFTEAEHPEREPYRSLLPPPDAVDVNDLKWYYDLTNAMPDRFVGGRSSSATLYLSAATMLHHEGRLSFDETSDAMAFVIADMVVSGEHSLPECMTPVVMAAGSSQPWQSTPLNLSKETPPLTAWLHLVSSETKNQMRSDARAALLQLVATPAPDLKVVKGLTMLLKATESQQPRSGPDGGERVAAAIHMQGNAELANAVRAGFNPAPGQRVSAGTVQPDQRRRSTGAGPGVDRDK